MSERRKRFNAQQASAILRSIAEDDSGVKSEIEDDVLDWELCSSDEMDDDEETEQLSDTQQPTVHVGDSQSADTVLPLNPIPLQVVMVILVRVLLKVRSNTRQQEMAHNGNLWNSA